MPKSWLPWSQSSQVRLLVMVVANVADAAVGGIVAAVVVERELAPAVAVVDYAAAVDLTVAVVATVADVAVVVAGVADAVVVDAAVAVVALAALPRHPDSLYQAAC